MDDQPKPSEPPKSDKKTALPPPLKPGNVLDSIFHKGGPMPTASLGFRALAFFLDFVLITAVAMVFIWKIAIPISHPGALHEYSTNIQETQAWLERYDSPIEGMQSYFNDKSSPLFTTSQDLNSAIEYAFNLAFLIFWLYFAIGEAFFGGSSFGKRLCCIRSVSTITLGPLPVFTAIVRAGVKTTAIFLLFPISIFIPLLGLLFNKRQQLLHDLCSRTAVIDERHMQVKR